MTRKQWLLHKVFNSMVLTGFVLTIVLSLTQPALAGYQPPPDQKPPSGYSDSSGVRGGGCKPIGGITLLAPVNHVGQTTRSRPVFAWHISEYKPEPITFTLYEFNPSGTISEVKSLQLLSSPGIMKLTLPEDFPPLSLGKRYLWQVASLCNPNRPSSQPIARTELEVVPISKELSKELSTANSRTVQVEIYARAGLWYDAFGEAMSKSNNRLLNQDAVGLLRDLAKVETSSQHEDLIKISINYQ